MTLRWLQKNEAGVGLPALVFVAIVKIVGKRMMGAAESDR